MQPIRAIRNMLAAVAAVAIVATAACGADKKSGSTGPDEVPPSGSVTGLYALKSVGGHALPAVLIDEDVSDEGQTFHLKVEILNGSVMLKAGGQYDASTEIRFTVDGQSQTESGQSSGTYSRSGSTITFNSSDDEIGSFSASIGNGQITAQIDMVGTGQSKAFVFKK